MQVFALGPATRNTGENEEKLITFLVIVSKEPCFGSSGYQEEDKQERNSHKDAKFLFYYVEMYVKAKFSF